MIRTLSFVQLTSQINILEHPQSPRVFAAIGRRPLSLQAVAVLDLSFPPAPRKSGYLGAAQGGRSGRGPAALVSARFVAAARTSPCSAEILHQTNDTLPCPPNDTHLCAKKGRVSETPKEWRLPTSAAVDSASGNPLERRFEQALTVAASSIFGFQLVRMKIHQHFTY